MTLLINLAILPVVLLLIYIYRCDKYEKEPLGLLAKAFLAGVCVTFATLLVTYPLMLICGYPSGQLLGVIYSSTLLSAIPEEGLKFVALYWLIWRNEEFNEFFDGIIYAVFISMGFAALENVLYVLNGGVEVGILRAVLSVPAHFLFAVIMGYYFSLAKMHNNSKLDLLKRVGLAMVAHAIFNALLGLIDLTAQIGVGVSLVIMLLFLGFDIVLWRRALAKIDHLTIKSHLQHRESAVDTE